MIDTLTIDIKTATTHYPVYIGSQLLQQQAIFEPFIGGSQVMIVSNETIAPHYLQHLCQTLSHYDVDTVILKDGEAYKNLATFEQILDALYQHHHHRDTTVIALGGGVIGDMAGFAASSYQRGVNFIQVPTSLLAQVDSSVGGKTGVNFAKAKNLVGAFHQPQAVIIDLATLQTLPAREFAAGMAEIIKAAMIADSDFFTWLSQQHQALTQLDGNALQHAIARSCEIKADFVARDEYEHGARALLNLGHTFAHALEAATYYQRYLHGEAVAIGLVCAAQFAVLNHGLDPAVAKSITQLCQQYQLPISLPAEITNQQIIALMKMDKKVLANKLRLIVPYDLADVRIVSDISELDIIASLDACRE